MQVGNALTDDFHDHLGLFQFMWSAGLISDQSYKKLNLFCDFQSFVHTSEQCEKVLDIAEKEFGNIDPYSIFTPSCTGNFSEADGKLRRRHVSNSTLNVCIGLALFFTLYHIFPCKDRHLLVFCSWQIYIIFWLK